MKRFVVVAAVVAGTLAVVPAASAQGKLTVVVPASGSADAVLYRAPCGEVGLVDSGEGALGAVLAQLDAWSARGQLRWIAPSHYDDDNLGDVIDTATAPGVSVQAIYDRGGDRTAKDTDLYRSYHDWVTDTGLRQPVDIGDALSLCTGDEQVTFTVVSAGTDGTAADGVAVTNENDKSVCLHVEHGDFNLATCGDVNGFEEGARADVETAVADEFGDVEVVKVNHEGSAYSSNATYVSKLSPEVAFIQAGANPYGHPSIDVFERWTEVAEVYVTNFDDGDVFAGEITIVTDGEDHFTVARARDEGRRLFWLDEAAAAPPQARPIEDACPPGVVPEDGFADAQNTVHEAAIDCVVWWQVSNGRSASSFGPSAAVNRAQMASLIARLILNSGGELPASPPDRFADDEGSVHETNINRLAAAYIVIGEEGPGRRYNPAGTVSRAQMASFLESAYEHVSATNLTAPRDYFTDDDGHVFEEEINEIAAPGFTGGTGDGYKPTGVVTRAQMASFLARVLDFAVEHGNATVPAAS